MPSRCPVIDFLGAVARRPRRSCRSTSRSSEQARKVREQLETSYGDAAARGHVAALPPDEAFRRLGRPRAARPARRRGSRSWRSTRTSRASATCAASRRWSSAAGSTTGSPTSARRASAATRSCSSPTATAAPSARSRSCASTTSSPCPSSAPRTRTPQRCSSPSASLSRGFRLADAALQIYARPTSSKRSAAPSEKRRNLAKTFLSDLRDLKVGDLVVHVDHGIGEFVGLKQLGVRGAGDGAQEFLELRYARRRQAVRPGRAARSHPEVHRRRAAGARSPGRHDVGEGQDARQEGDARHGRGAAEALRAAQGRARPRLRRRHALAGGVRGRVSRTS